MPGNTTTLEIGGAKVTVDTHALFGAWFEKHLGTPSCVGALTPCIPFPTLHEGEKYAGAIIEPNGKICHVVLLPGDVSKNWKDSLEWAKSIGGDLPDRVEQALLHKYMPEEFQKEAYWSNTQHAAGSDYAWFQGFGNGDQGDYYEGGKLRARAVRRLVI